MRDRFCSSGTRADIRQLTTGFPKKLLVAISVVVILAMCLGPAEAASLERKHRPHDNMPKATKDIGASRLDGSLKNHKRRHHGQPRSGTQTTKENWTTRRPMDPYEEAQIKLESKLSYTKDNFFRGRDDLKKIVVPGDYGSGMPLWMPKTNFVDIHFHKYENGTAKSKRIFKYLTQKLYKSLLDYHELFQRFNNIKAKSPDNEIARYNEKRYVFFNNTTHDLYSAIEDIKDFMIKFKLNRWQKIRGSKTKLHHIELFMDGSKYLMYDDLLLRGYGNLLENWHLEFNCSKVKRFQDRKVPLATCKQFHNNLKEKRNRRLKNKRRQRQHANLR